MKLKDALKHCQRTELIELAEAYDLELTNKSKKPKVLDQLVEFMTSENFLRVRMTCLTDEELECFIKLKKHPLNLYDVLTISHFRLNKLNLADFDDVNQLYVVYEDVYETFEKIYDDDFKKEQMRKGWLVKCSRFLINYYGVAPVEIFYQLYLKKFHDGIDEMIEYLSMIPTDVIAVDYGRVNMSDYGCKKEDKAYTDKGIVFGYDMIIDECATNLIALMRSQKDIDFYIPTYEEICTLYDNLYDINSYSYQKLYDFFDEELELSDEDTRYWCSMIWDSVSQDEEDEVNELLKSMVQELEFETEEQVKRFVELYADAHNNTRMIVLRGHTPKEVMGKMEKLDNCYS